MWSSLLLLSLSARAADPAPAAAVLLCDDGAACTEDLAFAQRILGSEPPITPIDLFLLLDAGGWSGGADQAQRFQNALYSAQDALDRKRWAALERATDAGFDALARWPGTVPADDLFALHFYAGAARVARGKPGAAYHFRQATAMVGGVQHAPPTEDPRFTRPWLDEARALTVGGNGWIEVQRGPDVTVRIDGERMTDARVAVLPGTHRLTATRADGIRTYEADVPVLAERTSRVTPVFTQEGDARWVRAQLGGAIDTLQAPVEVTDLLADWCAQHGVAELELLQVRLDRVEHPLPPVDIDAAPATRPAAAEGEAVDMGDGVPSTFADAVMQARADAERAPTELRRLKVVYFDPASRGFHVDSVRAEAPYTPTEHFRLGASTGYTSALGHGHATIDVGFLAAAGRFGAQLDLGLARADAPYHLQPGWIDRQLYHLDLLARWTPLEGRYSPYVTAGPELYVPIAVGARVGAGVDARFAPRWVASAGAFGAVAASRTGMPFGWGLNLGVARTY